MPNDTDVMKVVKFKFSDDEIIEILCKKNELIYNYKKQVIIEKISAHHAKYGMTYKKQAIINTDKLYCVYKGCLINNDIKVCELDDNTEIRCVLDNLYIDQLIKEESLRFQKKYTDIVGFSDVVNTLDELGYGVDAKKIANLLKKNNGDVGIVINNILDG